MPVAFMPMSTPHGSGKCGRFGKAARPPSHPLPFKVFIGYADLCAARHATAAIGEAVRTARRRFEIQPMLWRFDQLASTHWRARAVAAAMEADAIVLASDAATPLPASLEAWIYDFLAASRGRRVTLVAITGPADAWTISIEQPRAAHLPGKDEKHWIDSPAFQMAAPMPQVR
jgi:hypothetical protein